MRVPKTPETPVSNIPDVDRFMPMATTDEQLKVFIVKVNNLTLRYNTHNDRVLLEAIGSDRFNKN